MSTLKKFNKQNVKRGDTIIEVMMAIAVFCLVAVLSVTMMNLGTNNAQSALELAIARNEINAQAEALRFIHSAYISEKTLPEEPSNEAIGNSWYDNLVNNRYQQYRDLWEAITSNAITAEEAVESDLLNMSDFLNNNASSTKYNSYGCDRVYEKEGTSRWLAKYNAFILNTRNLNKIKKDSVSGKILGTDVNYSYVSAKAEPDVFQPAPLNARILYRKEPADTDIATNTDDSSTMISERTLYDDVYRAEGIWVVAVKGGTKDSSADNNEKPEFYDFYIESCWYGPNTTSPSTIDTVIRLYNPENV